MLKHPTLDQLYALGLRAWPRASGNQAQADDLDECEWLGLLLDREASWRQDKRFAARLRYAKLRQQACAEDVDYRSPRGLDRPLFQKLVEGHWIEAHEDLALVGPTGVGKSWLASALGHKACRDNRSVLSHRIPKLFEDLALARGAMAAIRASCVRWAAPTFSFSTIGVWNPSTGDRHDLLEILEERYGRRSTIVTSQLHVDRWQPVVNDPTYADAILDSLVHNAHRIELAGESLRRVRPSSEKLQMKASTRQQPKRNDRSARSPHHHGGIIPLQVATSCRRTWRFSRNPHRRGNIAARRAIPRGN